MKNGCYEYYDLPNSYRGQANCSICENLKLTDKKTDFYGKEYCYCEEKRTYVKPNSEICSNALISKSNYNRLGTYTQSGCYITTIVCNILGYDDNCELLMLLRSFRENYLKKKKNINYFNLLLEYDEIGPKISMAIQNEKNNYKLCLGILKFFLIPCVEYIKIDKYDEAINCYKNMVEHLKETLNIEPIAIKSEIPLDLETLGKGRIKIKPSEI